MTKINELIAKFKIELASKYGKEGLAVFGKPTAADVAEIKALKPEIMAELERRKAEREAKIEVARAEAAARLEQKKQEYLATADLRRCLVCRQDEFCNVTWSVETLAYSAEQDRYFSAEYGLSNYVALNYVTALMEKISQRKDSKFYGLECVAWEITDEEEAALLAEQAPAKEKAEKEAAEAAERKAAEEAAQKAAAEKKAAEKEARRASMKVEILEKGCYGKDEDSEIYANVEITDLVTGESAKFACRNVFDVGYIVNPLYAVGSGLQPGGVAVRGHWETFRDDENFTGWVTARPLTPFEKKALDYLREFPPVNAGIRM